MIRFTRIDDRDFACLGVEWTALLSASKQKSIFLTWEWLYSWWEQFLQNKTLYILLGYKNDELVAICPFCIVPSRTAWGSEILNLVFLGTEKVSSEYLDIICRPENMPEIIENLIRYLKEHKKEWDIFCFSDVLSDCSSLALIKQSAKAFGLKCTENFSNVCPFIPLPKTSDEMMQSLSKNMRYHVRRRSKALEKLDANYVSMNKFDEIHSGLDRLFDLHTQNWNTRNQTGNFADTRVRKFHKAFSKRVANKGWIRLTFIQISNEFVASLYGYEYGNIFWYYQAGMSPDYYQYSPGVVLFWKNIQESIRKDFTEFDCLRGTEDYKRRWTTSFKTTSTLKLYNNGLNTFLISTYDHNKQYVKKLIKYNTSTGFATKIP